jgi:hypothetical protein
LVKSEGEEMTDEKATKAALDKFDKWDEAAEITGFVFGARWQLKNLPRCKTCKYFSKTKGVCRNEAVYADTRQWLSVCDNFGCLLHSDLGKK